MSYMVRETRYWEEWMHDEFDWGYPRRSGTQRSERGSIHGLHPGSQSPIPAHISSRVPYTSACLMQVSATSKFAVNQILSAGRAKSCGRGCRPSRGRAPATHLGMATINDHHAPFPIHRTYGREASVTSRDRRRATGQSRPAVTRAGTLGLVTSGGQELPISRTL